VGGDGCRGGLEWPGVGGLGNPTGVRPPAEYGWNALPPAPGTGLASGCGNGLEVVRGSEGKKPATDERGGGPGGGHPGGCCCCCLLGWPTPPSMAMSAWGVGEAVPAAAGPAGAGPPCVAGLAGGSPPPPGDRSFRLPPGCMGGRPEPADPLSRNIFMAGTKEVL
jgi:hypothetical protein